MLVRKAGLDADALNYVSAIKEAGTRHMGSMVSDLLAFVRSRLGSQLPIERVTLDLSEACRAALAEACAGQPDCEPVLTVHGPVQGEWDRGLINQLLQNLIGNALQHGSHSRVVTVTLTGGAEQVLLSVHNRGTPMTKVRWPPCSTRWFAARAKTSACRAPHQPGVGPVYRQRSGQRPRRHH